MVKGWLKEALKQLVYKCDIQKQKPSDVNQRASVSRQGSII